MHEARCSSPLDLLENRKQGHRVRSGRRVASILVRQTGPWDIFDLHRNFPFGVNSKPRELPLGVASSLLVLLQADQSLVGNGFQIERFRSLIIRSEPPPT